MKRKLVNLLVPLLFVLLIGSTASGNTITVKNTNDSGPGSLRYAIASANSGDTINFKLIYPATITLTTGTLNIGTSLTISGPGPLNLAISGNNVVRVLYISSGATVRISGVTIENGVAPIGDCVFANGGGGVCNFGTLTLINSTISGNSAGYGGGILNFGTMTVTNSTVSGNVASIGPSLGDGGGICNSNPGTLTLTNSTVSGNSAASLGGGIFNSYDLTSPPPGTMTVTNSTISGNSASDGGGGIFNYSATITVTNSTISGNSGFVYAGGIFNYYGGTLTLKSTIVANSSGGNCGSTGGASSGGNNLSDDASCTFLISTGDLIHTPAGLDPSGLQDNGGPTKTIALLATSFAVDAIPPANCTLPDGTTPVATDQRGLTRPLARISHNK